MEYLVAYFALILFFSILLGVSSWRLFVKMGLPAWAAFVPFYNYYLISKHCHLPRWWNLLVHLPIVGLMMMIVFHVALMKKFGRDEVMDKVWTILTGWIFIGIVNYNPDSRVVKNSDIDEKKETLLGSLAFAAIFATFVHVYIAQPFAIPTGSMERTLLVGDFLFVNKWSYGFRLPMRPIALPFLQGTIFDTGEKGNPKDDPKSYVELAKMPYVRIPGFGEIKRNDIVVFNYPGDSVHVATDRRDPYVKRCVAVGGDMVEMREGRLYINGRPEVRMGDAEVQHQYSLRTSSELDTEAINEKYGFHPVSAQTDGNHFIYTFQGLTDRTYNELKKLPQVISSSETIDEKGRQEINYYPDYSRTDESGTQYAMSNKINVSASIFPLNKKWNADWYGPIRIPKPGDKIVITEENYPMYEKLIRTYEHNTLERKGNQFLINGQSTNTYTVKNRYYWMMGDNRDASLDARFFGFVPEENIMGSPIGIWMSIQGAFDEGKARIRWERMFKAVNTGEKEKTSYLWLAIIGLVVFFGWDYIKKLFKKKEDE